MKLRYLTANFLLFLAFTIPASAATYCSAVAPVTSNADGVTTGDLTFRGSDADDCYGLVAVQGGNNDSLAEINALNLWGGDWVATLKDENADGTLTNYLGFDWTISSPNTGQSGMWTLTLTDSGAPGGYILPLAVDFIGVLKAGNDYAAYFFDDVVFTALGPNNGTFQFTWTTSGLSHLSIYLRDGDIPDDPCPTCPDGDTPVPEPTSMILLGTGLVGVAASARRRLRKQ